LFDGLGGGGISAAAAKRHETKVGTRGRKLGGGVVGHKKGQKRLEKG